MKRLFTTIALLLYIVSLMAQTQEGIVKTRGRMIDGKHVPGKGLPGAVVSIKGRTDVGVKNNDGSFSFPTADKQFTIDSVTKKEYALVDADAVHKTYTQSTNPLYFIMETPEQLIQDKLKTERKIRRTLQNQLQEKEDEIERLKEENKISQHEYQQALQKIYTEQESNERLISEMAERYSKLDYDQLDDFYRQVSYHIEHGELVKADSMLRSRGNLEGQIEAQLEKGEAIQQEKEKLLQAEAVHIHDREELARRCYSYFENFKMQHQNDSAAKYIELRTKLDTTNVEWLTEAGTFIQDYLADYEKAVEYFKLSLRQSQCTNSNKDICIAYNNIGLVHYLLGLNNDALEYYHKALAAYDKNDWEIVTTYCNIGSVHYSNGEYEKTLTAFHKALELSESIPEQKDIKIADLYSNCGVIYSRIDSLHKALEFHEKALSIRISSLGEEDIDVALSYNNIGSIHYNSGNLDEAMEFYLKGLKIKEKLLKADHPSLANSYHNISHIYISKKDYPTAIDYQKKALEIRKKTLSQMSPELANSYNSIGAIYSKTGEFDKALEYYQKGLKIRIKAHGIVNRDVSTSYSNIALVYYKKHDYKQALQCLSKALEIRENIFEKDSPEVLEIKNAIAMIQRIMSDTAK